MVSRLITTIEAAEILGVDPSTIRHRIRKGKLKTERVGRDHLVSRRVIEIERHNKEVKRGNIIDIETRTPRLEPRVFCSRCGVSLTDTDVQAGYCTQCKVELK
jgi:excisionase family DNA binding protein